MLLKRLAENTAKYISAKFVSALRRRIAEHCGICMENKIKSINR
jgi:hypothetical protein